MSSPSLNIRDAVSPYDAADADIILRSSDGVDFRTHCLLLKSTSEVFADMFDGPHIGSGDEQKDGLSVVQMTENEQALRVLLSLCQKHSVSLDDMLTAAQLAMKFGISDTQSFRDAMRAYAPSVPERIYAVAWALQSRELVLLAARESMKSPFITKPAKQSRWRWYCPEFRDLSDYALTELIHFQFECIIAASEVHYYLEWFLSEGIPCCARSFGLHDHGTYVHDPTLAFNSSSANIGQPVAGPSRLPQPATPSAPPPNKNTSLGCTSPPDESIEIFQWFLDYLSYVAYNIRTSGEIYHLTLNSDILDRIIDSRCEKCQRRESKSVLLAAVKNFEPVIHKCIQGIVTECLNDIETRF